MKFWLAWRVRPVLSHKKGRDCQNSTTGLAFFNRVSKVKYMKKKHLKRHPLRRKTRKKKNVKIKRKIKRAKKIAKKIKIRKKIKKTKPVKPRKVKSEPVDFSPKSIFRPKIRVIGVGGGGGSIVSEIGQSLEKASFVIADTDVRAIKKKSGIKYFYFGEQITHGLGTGMNPDLAKSAAEKEKEKISKLLQGQDIIILVASLGGGLGSGATPVFAELSHNAGNVTLGIFTLPFRFEGKKKSKISHKAIKKLKEFLNAVITIPNERIFKIIDEKTSIMEAFSLVNKNLIGSLESLIDLIYNPGLINIDFADVRTILKGKGMAAFLNTAEASGKARTEEVIKKILSNPLFNCNIKAEKILFNISGGNNLSMLEVEKISRAISELNPRAKIIFGVSKNSKAKNKIKTTLLITGPSYRPKPAGGIKKESGLGPASAKALPAGRQASAAKRASVAGKVSTERAKKKVVKIKSVAKKIKKSQKTTIPISLELSKNKKAMIRRTALEVKKAEEIEESKKLNQESEWEIPAFLRRMKFKA